MEALRYSKPVTIETVECHLNPKHGGTTYVMCQGRFLCAVHLAVCVYTSCASDWWGFLPQLKSESARLHDSKSIARAT